MLEKIIHGRLSHLLHTKGILVPVHCASGKGYVLKVLPTSKQAVHSVLLNRRRRVGKISCDLAKVCECLNHEVLHIKLYLYAIKGTTVAQWLRCCATNQKIAGSILDGIIGIFH